MNLAMKLFDSHCHLDDRSYENELESVVKRANEAELRAMMVVGTGLQSSRRAINISHMFDGLYASVGIHPHDAEHCTEQKLTQLKQLAKDPRVKAWGEIGLDFNRMYSPREDQERWFIRQLEISREMALPVIFHERETRGRFLEILDAHWEPHRSGVVHCFSGNGSELDAYLALGLFIGITGIVTIKSRGEPLRQLVRRIPAEHLVVETDAPYLTPTPQRNKHRRNEPAFVRTVLLKLAQVREEAPEQLAATLWDNTCRLYGISPNSETHY
jgi:TatD DNase family protein